MGDPLAYQWQFNGTNFDGQTEQSLSLTNLQWSDAGNYTVIITNNYGSATSGVATLTVVWPPLITNQPTSLTVLAGSNVVLNVGVSGTGPFDCQWQLNSTNLPDGIITTIAGTGTAGFSGDGGLATNANMYPWCPALDTCGNLYIADRANNRIRKVSTNGIISTVAGNGAGGYSGDGGAATNASLGLPSGVALDASGNLFIADSFNCRIRKIDTNGLISTVAGNGIQGYSGDRGPATNAELNIPQMVTISTDGKLFFSELGNACIRKVDTNGIITTVGGGGKSYPGDGGAATNAQLSNPWGVAVDTSGNLFIADAYHFRIRKVGTNGIITTVAGGGTNYPGDGGAATNASLSQPMGLVVDPSGNLFFADVQRIRRVNTNGIITTVAGNGTSGYSGDGGAATNAALNNPKGLAIDATGNLFIADPSNYRVREVINTRLPSLVLKNVTLDKAGVYQVLVTGPGGSVTSSNIALTVLNIPVIGSPLVNADGSVTLNLSTTPNISSRIYCATNLNDPTVWQPIYTNLAGGTWQFTDTNASGQPTRFYRLSTP